MHLRYLFAAAAAICCTQATPLTWNGTSNAKDTAASLAQNLMSYYSNADNGVLPQPYYWWESGGMWASLITYWHTTGDTTYNTAVSQALAAQAGSAGDFMGPNTLGNDDQLWWGIAAMTAAEYNLPTTGPSWSSLAENVWNEVSARWDTSSCNGGLHWQISTSAAGYSYKNAISNGLFFQLSARLARYTGNSNYETWAAKTFQWVESVGLVDNSTYAVYDGTDDTEQCSSLDHDQWSYNYGTFLYGAAVMADATGDSATWEPVVNGLLSAIQSTFTRTDILLEQCEQSNTCDADQLSFKAYVARWLAGTAQLVPSTQSTVATILKASAGGASSSCGDGPGGNTCGTQWWTNTFDGVQGVGQQMAALEVIQGLLTGQAPLPQKMARKLARRFAA